MPAFARRRLAPARTKRNHRCRRRRHLATGGLALVEELRAVRRRLDALGGRGDGRKKDAVESAHRDNQRIGRVARFEHAVRVAPQSANWWARELARKDSLAHVVGVASSAWVASSPISA